MKIFLDTEFQEMPDSRLLPISFGFVREDGQELYTALKDVFDDDLSEWVKRYVGRHLDWIDGNAMTMARKRTTGDDREEAKFLIKRFCEDSPEFWADYAAHDWVVTTQLFGTMMDLPKGWPMYCHDFQQYLDHAGQPASKLYTRAVLDQGPKQDPSTLHHALHDARHLKAQYDFIQSRL